MNTIIGFEKKPPIASPIVFYRGVSQRGLQKNNLARLTHKMGLRLVACSLLVLSHGTCALLAPPLAKRPVATSRRVCTGPEAMADDGSRGGLRILEWIPSQKLLVTTARFAWTTFWKVMLSELAPQSPEGAYVRPAPQTGSGASWPSDRPMVKGR